MAIEHQTYLSAQQVAQRYSVSRATIWRWSGSDAGFPRPTKLGAACTRWRLSDLVAWEQGEEATNDVQ